MVMRKIRNISALPLFFDADNEASGAQAPQDIPDIEAKPAVTQHRSARNLPMEVDQLTERIQNMFASDELLKSVIIKGEIREAKLHTSGHYYFALMGEKSRITCALFKQHSGYVPSWPRDGDKVIAEGKVDVYQARGTYQFYARHLIPVGEGAMERARQEVKLKLEAEGLFSPELKRPLPEYPERVAVVTSQTGAAVQDVLKVASTRWKACEIVVIPTQVQGVTAPGEIIEALRRAAFVPRAECIMLVRGGGGREDLLPFDDADVARAVRSCPIPVITGLGHQQDTTLCDLAADYAAPTPSAAAERLFPDSRAVSNALDALLFRMKKALTTRIERANNSVDSFERKLQFKIESNIKKADSYLKNARLRLINGIEAPLSAEREAMARRAAALDALSPLSVLARGFVTCESNGARLLSIQQVTAGDAVDINFTDGRAEAKITSAIPI
ncbi:MAG: exodeoxyribonuclease VII large subunit [Synergistaceae bacterium]|nr:exodeoxyribonuclease VII large subunit [Synergistaceae bacterium]